LLIPIDKIQNIPTSYFQDRLELLKKANSLPPIVVRKATHGFWLMDGAHRLKISVDSGNKFIDAIIKE